MTLDYAAGQGILERYAAARVRFDGDALVALFDDDAEYHEGPFVVPMVGHNALRAWLLEASARQQDLEFTVERHWVSGMTVLASWHLSYVHATDRSLVRVAGFLVADIAPDGRIARLREWSEVAPVG